MAKESNTPKAINIVRPGHSITTAPKFQVFSPLRNNGKPPSDIHKPKVMTAAQISLNDRPGLALFAPQNQKRNVDAPIDPSHRQAAFPPKRIPPVIISAATLNSSSAHVSTGSYVSRNTVKSQLSAHSSTSRASSVVSSRSDASLGLASVHSERGSKSHRPNSSDLYTIRRPPGVVISSDISLNEPLRRSVHVSIAENDLDEDHRSRHYDTSTNVEDDISSEPDSESIYEKSDDVSILDSDDEQDIDNNDVLGEDDEDSPVNEARINRKVADLEISNKSLLAVNAMLESTVRKQAMQIAELKKSKPSTDLLDVQGTNQDNIEVDQLIIDQGEEDEQFQRISTIIDRLIEQAKSAIDYKISNAGRVLSQYDQPEDSILGTNSSLSLSGTDADEEGETGESSASSSPLNLTVPKRAALDSPLHQRLQQQQRRPQSFSRQSVSSQNLGTPPTSRDVRPSKSTAVLPSTSLRLSTASTRKVASANPILPSNNSRKSKPRGFHQGRVHVK